MKIVKFKRDRPLDPSNLYKDRKCNIIERSLIQLANDHFYTKEDLKTKLEVLKNEYDHLNDLFEARMDAYIDLLEEHRLLARRLELSEIKGLADPDPITYQRKVKTK